MSISSVQSCNKLRTEVFYGLLNKQKALKAQYGFLQKESKAQLEACKTALDKKSAEVVRLKKELEKANTRIDELTSSLGIERTGRQKDSKEHEEKLAELASRGTTVEKELKVLQAKCHTLLAELVVITNEMGRKCSFAIISYFFLSDLSLALSNNLTRCSFSYVRVLRNHRHIGLPRGRESPSPASRE